MLLENQLATVARYSSSLLPSSGHTPFVQTGAETSNTGADCGGCETEPTRFSE